MTDFEILPYVGVGPLRFGMTPDEVATVLGPPAFSVPDEDAAVIVYYRGDNAIQTSHDARTNRLVLASFYFPVAGLRLYDHSLNWERSADWFEWLKQADSSARQKYGITVFFRFGISVAGFQGAENGQKSMTVFDRGQWCPDDPDFGPLP